MEAERKADKWIETGQKNIKIGFVFYILSFSRRSKYLPVYLTISSINKLGACGYSLN